MAARWRTWDMEFLDSMWAARHANGDSESISARPVGKDRGFSKLRNLKVSSIVLPKAALLSNDELCPTNSSSRQCGRGRSLRNRALSYDKPGRRPGERDQATSEVKLGKKFLGSEYLYEELFPGLNESNVHQSEKSTLSDKPRASQSTKGSPSTLPDKSIPPALHDDKPRAWPSTRSSQSTLSDKSIPPTTHQSSLYDKPRPTHQSSLYDKPRPFPNSRQPTQPGKPLVNFAMINNKIRSQSTSSTSSLTQDKTSSYHNFGPPSHRFGRSLNPPRSKLQNVDHQSNTPPIRSTSQGKAVPLNTSSQQSQPSRKPFAKPPRTFIRPIIKSLVGDVERTCKIKNQTPIQPSLKPLCTVVDKIHQPQNNNYQREIVKQSTKSSDSSTSTQSLANENKKTSSNHHQPPKSSDRSPIAEAAKELNVKNGLTPPQDIPVTEVSKSMDDSELPTAITESSGNDQAIELPYDSLVDESVLVSGTSVIDTTTVSNTGNDVDTTLDDVHHQTVQVRNHGDSSTWRTSHSFSTEPSCVDDSIPSDTQTKLSENLSDESSSKVGSDNESSEPSTKTDNPTYLDIVVPSSIGGENLSDESLSKVDSDNESSEPSTKTDNPVYLDIVVPSSIGGGNLSDESSSKVDSVTDSDEGLSHQKHQSEQVDSASDNHTRTTPSTVNQSSQISDICVLESHTTPSDNKCSCIPTADTISSNAKLTEDVEHERNQTSSAIDENPSCSDIEEHSSQLALLDQSTKDEQPIFIDQQTIQTVTLENLSSDPSVRCLGNDDGESIQLSEECPTDGSQNLSNTNHQSIDEQDCFDISDDILQLSDDHQSIDEQDCFDISDDILQLSDDHQSIDEQDCSDISDDILQLSDDHQSTNEQDSLDILDDIVKSSDDHQANTEQDHSAIADEGYQANKDEDNLIIINDILNDLVRLSHDCRANTEQDHCAITDNDCEASKERDNLIIINNVQQSDDLTQQQKTSIIIIDDIKEPCDDHPSIKQPDNAIPIEDVWQSDDDHSSVEGPIDDKWESIDDYPSSIEQPEKAVTADVWYFDDHASIQGPDNAVATDVWQSDDHLSIQGPDNAVTTDDVQQSDDHQPIQGPDNTVTADDVQQSDDHQPILGPDNTVTIEDMKQLSDDRPSILGPDNTVTIEDMKQLSDDRPSILGPDNTVTIEDMKQLSDDRPSILGPDNTVTIEDMKQLSDGRPSILGPDNTVTIDDMKQLSDGRPSILGPDNTVTIEDMKQLSDDRPSIQGPDNTVTIEDMKQLSDDRPSILGPDNTVTIEDMKQLSDDRPSILGPDNTVTIDGVWQSDDDHSSIEDSDNSVTSDDKWKLIDDHQPDNSVTIDNIKRPSDDHQSTEQQDNSVTIDDIKRLSDDHQSTEQQDNSVTIDDIKRPSDDHQSTEQQDNSVTIDDIKRPSDDHQSTEQQDNSVTIDDIKRPSDDHQSTEQQDNSVTIDDIKRPSDDHQSTEQQNNSVTINDIKRPSDDHQSNEQQDNSVTIDDIKRPSDDHQSTEQQDNSVTIDDIKRPSDDDHRDISDVMDDTKQSTDSTLYTITTPATSNNNFFGSPNISISITKKELSDGTILDQESTDARRSSQDNHWTSLEIEPSGSEEEIADEPCDVKLENLPLTLTEEDLLEIIEPYGSVISCTFKEETTFKSSIVRMADAISGEWLAVSLDGLEIDGHRMRTTLDVEET